MNSPASETDVAPHRPTNASHSAIELRGVQHWFRKFQALLDITFDVPPQSLHGFVGPNGAGKTTVLRIVCTLLKPQVGSIRVFGMDIVDDYKEVRRRIGFMPDHFSMYRQMTVYEYLDFFAAAYGLPLETRTKVLKDVLELTDMGAHGKDLINGLSRGMQQRVGLARVLVNDPDLLLLDEPASGLDPRARIELMEILRALRGMGKTIVISSHILSELAELCDSVTVIDRGHIKYCGSMEGLLDHSHEYPAYRLTPNEPLDGLVDQLAEALGIMAVLPIEGSHDVRVEFDPEQLDTNAVLQAAMSLGITVNGFSRAQRHLNQAFMDLTEKGVR